MLIINADDFGASPSATDAILTAWRAGVVTCASAMVWMRDSERAATLAAESGLPVGLHLNLTLPFAAGDAPAGVRERQARLTEVFGRESWREDDPLAVPRDLLRDAVSDQLDRYREQYGEPTHINGHHHIHLQQPVLELLPRELPVRPIVRAPSQARMRPNGRERRLRRHFIAAELAFSFENLHPTLGGEGFEAVEAADTDAVIEVVTHPQRPPELEALLSPEWRGLTDRLSCGSHADLQRSRRAI